TMNDATNFDEVYESIEMMATATGTETEGEEIITTMQDDLTALEEKASEISEEDMKKVFVEISPEPEIFTPGNNTFENEILTKINEHTSELQSRFDLVCRLLLEKKKK